MSNGHGFWPGAQQRHDRTLKKVLLQTLDITACSRSTRILGNQCNGLHCLGIGLAITPDDELPPPMPGTSAQQGDICEEEKERIRTMQLDESEGEHEGSEPMEPNTAIDDSNVEGESEESDTDSAYLDHWEVSLKNIASLQEQEPCHSLKQRQLGLLAAEVKRTVDERESQEERARLRVLEETKERWISLGMLKEDDAHLLDVSQRPLSSECRPF